MHSIAMTTAVPFNVLIPARMASSRLPDKPLADLAGLPMIVRVARAAQRSGAQHVVVACDDVRIQAACAVHQIECVLTDVNHPTGSDRLAQACQLLGWSNEVIVVNVQGDEPLIDPVLIAQCAQALAQQSDCVMSTAAHPIERSQDWFNPNVVKVVLNQASRALYFSRAPIPYWRDNPDQSLPPQMPVLRHIGIYAYRVGFLKKFPQLSVCALEAVESLEQLRVMWHGYSIAVHRAAGAPAPGVDTPEDLARVRQILADTGV